MHMSISVKVILLVSALILPLSLIALSLTYTSINTTIEQVTASEQSMADVHMENLDTRMRNAALLLYYFVKEDENCIQMLKQEEGYSYQRAKMLFRNSFKLFADMINGADGYYYFMRDKNDFFFYGKNTIPMTIKNYIKENILTNTSILGWKLHIVGEEQHLILLFSVGYATYGAWINLETAKNDMLSDINYESAVVEYISKKELKEPDKDQIMIISRGRNIAMYISQDRAEVLERFSLRQRILQFVPLAFLLSIPLIYILINHLLLAPLKKMNYAQHQLQNGNFSYRIREKGNSPEYEEVFQAFNMMAEQLYNYKIETYEKEIARQKLEMHNLQLHIRPHALMNTFNLIQTLVQRGEKDSVEDVIMYLSEYFRFISKSRGDLEIYAKELSMTESYLKTASIRYNHMIKVDIDVDMEVRIVRMPPLLIHSFIENAVKHGVKRGKILHISLKGKCENGIVTFCIIDDGNGMRTDILEQNQAIFRGEYEPENHSKHVGLYNSYKRLKGFYGEDAKIEVESEQGIMTRFTICFPDRYGGEK